ncbi:DUF4453 domain-containing protein [Jannaschia sp. CCS1]|uniref:DUF4453 domain-containing protein n=1 Tax=Jannaschia sp. (strain CCS1) TaxID=290400 RepID=UPI000053D7B8|nr:DUF4453 domain-containing protein [Jannaschia sp. CCS1]ABD56799.1 hypothetical protein Jann_3882 [Jannaschia sp. CCS1]
MIRIAVLLALTGFTGPASAQNSSFCQELWLSRNTVMDRAGQCFGTPLGQAVFDNSDCVEGGLRLTPMDAEIVRLAQQTEDWANCQVDTQAGQLSGDVEPFRTRLRELVTIPVRGDSEHGCRGYGGPPVALHAGTSPSTTVIGTLVAAQGFSVSHITMRSGWEYLEVYDPDGPVVAHGWTRNDLETMVASCTFFAG